MCLRYIRAFASNFELCVTRSRVAGTAPYQIMLSVGGQSRRQIQWDGVNAVELQLEANRL